MFELHTNVGSWSQTEVLQKFHRGVPEYVNAKPDTAGGESDIAVAPRELHFDSSSEASVDYTSLSSFHAV